MHSKKIENILRLESEDRYEYSIREIVKLEEIWVVAVPENIVTIVDRNGQETLPVWPHKEVAEICVLEEMKHSDWYLKSIDLSVFLDKCIPDMKKSGIDFGVFYNEKRKCLSVDSHRLEADLNNELEGEC